MSGQVAIERLAIRLKGLPEAEARALARQLGPALEAELRALSLDGKGLRRIARLDAGALPAAGGARGVAEALGRTLAARLGGGGES